MLQLAYVKGSNIRLNVSVNSTDLQGVECFLWHTKALWSQQVIREMVRLRLRASVFFDDGQRQLIADKRILHWRKTRKSILKMAELYRVINLARVYIYRIVFCGSLKFKQERGFSEHAGIISLQGY